VSRPALRLADIRRDAQRLVTVAELTERVTKLEATIAEMAARLQRLEAARKDQHNGEDGIDIEALIG
jgi:uncharacterized small protein (DUF1192 family)